MTLYNSDSKSFKDTSQILQEFPEKVCNEIDPMVKLKIIRALENGQSKVDVAREFGIHPQTITYIYKQKDTAKRKYPQKHNHPKEVPWVPELNTTGNPDQILLEWLKIHTNNGNVDKEKLREKAQEIINVKSEESTDNWLREFCRKHNIINHTLNIECSSQAKAEWMKLCKDANTKDLYVGGVCALSHTLDFSDYDDYDESDNYVSILFLFNITGFDKKQLTLVGRDSLDSATTSVPVNYWRRNNPCLNISILTNYFRKWNDDLKAKEENCLLVLNVPDEILEKINYSNIKIINLLNKEFVTNTMEKVIECFKFNYRKLQITRKLVYATDSSQMKLLDYIDMISAAWYSVPCVYIQSLFLSPKEGCVYISNVDISGNHSLSQWCRMHQLPIDSNLYSDKLDKYIFCDKQLPTMDFTQLNEERPNDIHAFLGYDYFLSNSAIEAYQATKRLVSYLQGESAGESVIESAKSLENNLEYGVLSELHQIIASTSENNDSE